jgi:subtilisin family serine protease
MHHSKMSLNSLGPPVKWACFSLLLAYFIAPVHAADRVPNEVLVKLKSANAIASIQSQYQILGTSQFGQRPIYRLSFATGTSIDTVVASLRADTDRVLLAEPHYTHQTPEARRSRAWVVGEPTAYAAQWAPEVIRLKLAHTYSRGENVRVAVLDTGVDTTHPALAGKLLPGFDFVDNDSDPSESAQANFGYGHGTHVAALVALAAPQAKIVPYRVLDSNGEGNAWVLAEAVSKAIDPDGDAATNDGAHVINLSLGTAFKSDVLVSIAKLFSCEGQDDTDPLLNFADPGYNADKQRCAEGGGTVLIAAAGNDGSSSVREYPAAVSAYGMLSVGASAQNNTLASFSNSGSWVQVAAPGEGITSAVPIGANAPSGYATWSGTSMAAPLAAGVAALIRSANPNMPAKEIVRKIARGGTNLTGTNIKQIDAAAAVEACRMDIDGDGQVLATTDGLILSRAMLGMTGSALTSAVSPTANRTTATDIRNYLANVCGLALP